MLFYHRVGCGKSGVGLDCGDWEGFARWSMAAGRREDAKRGWLFPLRELWPRLSLLKDRREVLRFEFKVPGRIERNKVAGDGGWLVHK